MTNSGFNPKFQYGEVPIDLQGHKEDQVGNTPRQCSIAESFFEWLHTRQNQQAAEMLQINEMNDNPNIDPEDQAVEVEHGDLTILEIRGGRRTWRFYRPDANRMNRPTLLDLQVEAGTTMSLIRHAIFRRWPDLTFLERQWEVIAVHESVTASHLIPEQMECYLIKTDDETPEDHTVTLNEYQRWRLEMKTFASALVPKITKRMNDVSSFLYFPDEGHRCFSRPCTLRINGALVNLPQIIDIPPGSYLVNSDFDRSASVRSTTGPYPQDDFMWHRSTGWERLVGLQMGIASQRRHADFHGPARLYQEALATMFHHLYHLQKGETLTSSQVIIVGATAFQNFAGPQAVSILSYDLGTDISEGFPSLIEDLVLNDLTEDHWSKFFLEPHPSVSQTTLPQTGQILFLRPHAVHQPLHCFLAEVFLMDEPGKPTLELAEMILQYGRTPTNRDTLLRLTEQHGACLQAECLLILNGRHVTERGEPHALPDGSTLQLMIWMKDDEDVVMQPISVSEDMEGHQDLHDDQSRADTATQTMDRPLEPPPGFFGNGVLMTAIVGCWLKKIFSGQDTIRPQRPRRNSRCRRPRWLIFGILWLSTTAPLVCALHLHLQGAHYRVGEATNPGPDLWLGTANPTGMRNKESTLAALPPGIWGVTETHLSGINMRSVVGTLKREAVQQNRQLQCLPGAPLPLRARSQSTGTWAGVLTFADALLRNVQIHWPSQEFQLGRAQITQAWCGPFSILGACVYGWAKGPTWPQALRDTNRLFQVLVQEIALSRGGPRYIMGDFNHALQDIEGWKVLQDLGWKDSQDLANELWNQEHRFTCKGRTITDHVLISPELVKLVREVNTWEWFADHSALGLRLELPCISPTQTVWTLPGEIPWKDIKYDQWYHEERQMEDRRRVPLDDRVTALATDYENSFAGHSDQFRQLPNHLKGRCQRLYPELREAAPPLLKPSRPGEVQMSQETLGRAVQKWFMQLRRLQSLLHSVRADKQTVDAKLYRIELWAAIVRAKGFQGGFTKWWTERPTKAAGLCAELPAEPPQLHLLEAIFHDFEINYRKLEAWHARQRGQLLKAQYAKHTTKIFEVVKKEPKGGIHYLEKKIHTTVVSTDAGGGQITLDHAIPENAPITISSGGLSKPAHFLSDNTVQIDDEWLIQPDTAAEITCHYTTPQEIQTELGTFWQEKWWKDNPPQTAEWQRIMAFAEAYLPRGQSADTPLSLEAWTDINKRYGPHSAGGPDGLDRRDLTWSPPIFQQELVDILNTCEQECYWPKVWRKGFVHSLAKKEGAVHSNEFRPVIVYSMVYRSWSSARAKTFLQILSRHANEYQFGFLPGKEPAELWLATQAMIETGLQQKFNIAGFVTDIRKAFECLPREPVRMLAKHLGLPDQAVALWYEFLRVTERHFVVQGEIGPEHKSNSGFPEGCALSCCAMVLAGLALHQYMRVFSGMTLTLSFVDNIELLAEDAWNLQRSIICLQTWMDMWKLDLDTDKSFVWAIDPSQRQEVGALGWKTETGTKDLGAQMAYGSRKTVQVQKSRIASLDGLWPRLRRCLAPLWQKVQLIYIALWPKAFYGISVCTLGWGHIKTLRTTVMRTLGWAKAGANAGLRLGILNDPRLDPGFYQALQVLNTFRRLVIKQPGLQDQWESYMQEYTGSTHQGPFAKLLEICHQLRWQIDTPHLRDRHGNVIRWLEMEDKAFLALLREAWSWKIWEEVQIRKDLGGLYGIDVQVLKSAKRKLLPHLRESISVLQDGTFVETRIHAKYDFTKETACQLCGQEDSLEHRCRLCPMMTEVYSKHQRILNRWDELSEAKRLRLLPSANPHLETFRRHLSDREDHCVMSPLQHAHTHLHLFTDGSCYGGSIPEYALGAWAVISPQEDRCIAKGCLGGLSQSGDRAELKAAMAAVEISITADCPMTLWTDSTYAAEGILRLLRNPHDIPDISNHDYWLELQGLIIECRHEIQVQHVPGHSNVPAVDNDPGDWAARWNDRADREAQLAQRLHADAWRCYHQLWSHHERELQDLHDLQGLHLDVCAHFATKHQPEEDETEDRGISPEDLMVERGCPDSPNPLTGLDFTDQNAKLAMECVFGRRFVSWMMTWIQTLADDPNATMIKLTYLEMAIYVGKVGRDHLPRVHPHKPNCWCDTNMTGAAEPTLGATLRCLRTFIKLLEQCFSLSVAKWTGLNLASMGVHTPQNGVTFPITEDVLRQTTNGLLAFTSSRPIRVTNDLARPLRD